MSSLVSASEIPVEGPEIFAPPLVDCPGVCLKGLGLFRNQKWLVRGLDWAVPRGSFVALVGPSGVGKSSLLSCLAGIFQATEGCVEYHCREDQDCTHPAEDFQKRIGFVFQNFMLVNNSSLLSNVLCGRLGRRRWWRTLIGFSREDRREAAAILENLGLRPNLHRWVAEVSGGEQQRTAVARALFQEPEIYLADEPVSNLDVYLTGRVLGILRQEASLHKRTVFCVLHSPELVERFADFALSLNPQRPEAWHVREVRSFSS